MFRLYMLLCFTLFNFSIKAQTIQIPAFTGYAVPAETNESSLFSEKYGLQNWSNTQQQINYFFYVRKPGKLVLGLLAKNDQLGSIVKLTFVGKEFSIKIPFSKTFTKIKVGEVIIQDSGFFQITLQGIKKGGKTIADIKSIELAGPSAEEIHYNAKARRNSASVHLRYPLADSIKAIAFYNEITIPEGADHLHSFYMACGFARGYFGIQVNSETERRVIFSVWDAGNEAISRTKVNDSNRVKLLAKGDAVITNDFGNEGTGGHSHWVYPWKTGKTYQLMVTATSDSATQTTIYTGYFFLPGLQKWKLIASFIAPKDGNKLRNLYSFNENFWGNNGQLQRKALFGNQWVQKENGQWVPLTMATFSYDGTGRSYDRIDYGAGVVGGDFYLWNGGFQKANVKYGDTLLKTASDKKPVINLRQNADSSEQAAIENTILLDAVLKKKIDTTGTKEGVFYQILKEGIGPFVSLNDTVTILYKVSLFANGSLVEETKDTPATFPLKRLIKGWQVGLPLCKIGGKIRLYIPSGLAYSISSRSKAIPPNSILEFEIEVLNVKQQKI